MLCTFGSDIRIWEFPHPREIAVRSVIAAPSPAKQPFVDFTEERRFLRGNGGYAEWDFHGNACGFCLTAGDAAYFDEAFDRLIVCDNAGLSLSRKGRLACRFF
jgi:hypothetical protein